MQYALGRRQKDFSSFKLPWFARNGLALAKIRFFMGGLINWLMGGERARVDYRDSSARLEADGDRK